MNYLRNPRFNHQSEQASESALVSRNTNETGNRLGGMGGCPIILNPVKENNLSAEMLRLYESLLPTKESHEKRKLLASKVEKILNDEFLDRDIKVHMFGSSMNELGTTQSDVDLCVTTQWNGLKNIFNLSSCLGKHMSVEQIVSKAKVPIVRLFDQKLELACDINVNNTLALHNTRLIRNYVNIDARVRPLAMIVKYWARRRVLNDAAKGGTISTYTWTCIILNFLQMRDPPILPVLHKLPHENVEPIMVNGEDASFYEDVASLSEFGSPNKESVGGLLFAFFRRMAFEFDYDNHVISLRQGKYLTKAEKGWDTCKGWKMLCVEEPFNTARNLGNSADDISVNGLKEEFRRAYEILYESACLERLCEEYHFPNSYNNNNNGYYYHHHHYQPRYNKYKRGNGKPNGSWKPNRKFLTKQNGQNNCLSNTTDNFHDMNVKSNDPQDDEEDGSSMRRFDSVSSSKQNGHYNGSEESTPVSENVYYHYENNDGPARKQFDNIQNQNKRYTQHHNVPKNDEQLRPQFRPKNNLYTTKKKNDDQFHNHGQSQDYEYEGFVRHDSIWNQNQPVYKNNNQKADNSSHSKKNSARFQQPSCPDQKPYYTPTFYDSDNKHNNNIGYSRHPSIPSDSDQKSFVNYNPCDSEKRSYYKSNLNKHGYNSKQVEEQIIDDLSSNSNIDRSNPIQTSSPKSSHKSSNRNRNFKPRNHQKPSENVDSANNYYSHNNYNSIPPSNSGNGSLPVTLPILNNFTNPLLYHRPTNDGSTNYQRRMSHQSSSDGSNSQTSGNTSNTSNTSYSQTSGNTGNTSNTNYNNNYVKNSNYQKHNNSIQNNYQHQNQNKSNNNNSFSYCKKRKHYNNHNNTNGYNNSGRMNNTTNNLPSTIPFNYNDSNFQDATFNTPSHVNQGQGGQGHYGGDYNVNGEINGHKIHNNFKNVNNNNNNSNGLKGSNGQYYTNTTKIINVNSNTNNGTKLANGGNNFSNRSMSSNNSNNNYSRSNSSNHNNNNNYMKSQNNNNNNANSLKPINGNNYKPFDGSNNSSTQTKNNYSNQTKNGGNNPNSNKKRNNKSTRGGVKAENKEDGVNYQHQCPQEASQNSHNFQQKKVGQYGQNNIGGKGKGHRKYSYPKQNVECQQQQ